MEFDGRRGRRRSYGVGVFVWRMCSLTHAGNEASCGAGVLLSVLDGLRGVPVARAHLTENWCP